MVNREETCSRHLSLYFLFYVLNLPKYGSEIFSPYINRERVYVLLAWLLEENSSVTIANKTQQFATATQTNLQAPLLPCAACFVFVETTGPSVKHRRLFLSLSLTQPYSEVIK
jgi:hypothetical protein